MTVKLYENKKALHRCGDIGARWIIASPVVIVHKSDFNTFLSPSAVSWTNSALLHHVLTLTLTISLLTPDLELGREQGFHPPPAARSSQPAWQQLHAATLG